MNKSQSLHFTKDDIEHVINVAVCETNEGIDLVACYEKGSLDVQPMTEVAHWPVFYEPRNDFDAGHVAIGNGRIEIALPELRRLGLGTLLMSIIIDWIKTQPSVPVAPINLSADDARTKQERETRNRFYEKFGFVFDYEDGESWGESRRILSAELRLPELFHEGWNVTCD